MNRVNRRTDETYGGRAGRDMETEVGPVTLPFTSLFMNGPGLSPLVTSVVRGPAHYVPLALHAVGASRLVTEGRET